MARTARKASGRPLGDPNVWVPTMCGVYPNLAISHYLIGCYMYYVEDDPILSDDTFDGFLVPTLGARGPNAYTHPHKALIPWDFLKSGFHLTYPNSVIGAAGAMRRAFGRSSSD